MAGYDSSKATVSGYTHPGGASILRWDPTDQIWGRYMALSDNAGVKYSTYTYSRLSADDFSEQDQNGALGTKLSADRTQTLVDQFAFDLDLELRWDRTV